MITFPLTEFVTTKDATFEEGVIKNVIVLGPVSRNRRQYTKRAMQGAAGLYEGMSVYVNHPEKKGGLRTAEDRFGKLEGVRFVEGEGRLRGDLRHLATHPMASRVKEDLDRGLGFFGLSHVADGAGRKENGIEIVEAITNVAEVDLVTNPATCKSLMEQGGAAAADGTDPAKAMQEAMAQAVMAVVMDGSLDVQGKLDKIKVILENAEELAGDGADTSGADTSQGTEQTQALVARLVEAELKKQLAKKYTKPTYTPGRQPIHAVEQTAPEDPKELARWLRRKD